MNDDDSDVDKKKRSRLALGARASDVAAPRGGSLLSVARDPEDDPVARHRAARSRRESAPSPLLSALARMEGFRAEPTQPAELADEAALQRAPQPTAEEDTPSWWKLRNLLSPKLKYEQPEPKPAPLPRRPIQPAPATTAREIPAEEPVEEELPHEFPVDEPAPMPVAPVVAPRPVRVAPEPARVAPEPVSAETGDAHWQPLIDPLKVIGGVGNSMLLILATTVLGGLIGAAIAMSTPKKYESIAELLVDPRDLKVSDRDLTQTGLPSDATLALVENQVRVITSSTVLNKVVDQLKLQDDPEFNGERQGAGIGDIVGGLRALLSGGQSGEGGDRRHALAVSNLAEALHVERAGKTFIVTIGATTESPEKSADVANAVKDVFLQTTGMLQSDTAGRAASELTSRLDELRASLDEAERKAEKFRAEHDLIDAQGRLISDDELVKLNDQLAIARARTIELNARAASARSMKVDSVITGAFPEAMSSPVMSELRSQYAATSQQADQLSVKLGPRHPQYLAMQAQLDGARDLIAGELQRIVASVQTELKRAVQQEQDLAARLAQLKVHSTDVNSDLVTMRELEREAAAKRAVYENYLLRAKEAGEQRDINIANISVLSPAYPPLESTGPSRAIIAFGGALLGFIVGIGLGMLRGIASSLREGNAARRGSRPFAPAAGNARAFVDAPLGGAPGGAERVDTPADVDPPAQEPAPKSQEEAVNPLVRLMHSFRSPPVAAGDTNPAAAPRSTFDPAANASAPEPLANQEPAPMYHYPQQPSAYPQQASAYPSHQPAYPPQQPQAYSHAAPYPPQAVQPAPYMPQQPLPPYPPAFVQQPAPYPPHFASQPAAYPYPPAPPQPAFHGWQPQPAPVSAYGYPQPAAPAYPAYAPMPQQPAPYPQDFRPVNQPAPEPRYAASPREVSPLEEVRESLREFREAIRDLTEDRARRRVVSRG